MKLLVTDLDRTLLPNGSEEDQNMIPALMRIVGDTGLVLAYASGRNLDMLRDAISEYNIPLPDYFAAEVGTVVYKKIGDELVRDPAWNTYVTEQAPKWDWTALKDAVVESLDSKIRLQEEFKQNPFKLSFYLDDEDLRETVVSSMENIIADKDISAVVVFSVDPILKVGLIDVLPTIATKACAVEFIRNQLQLDKNDVIYAGDSGNDILPLTAGYNAIVVNNAPAEVKEVVAGNKNPARRSYIASGKFGLNGNYAAGIVEGLLHFGLIDQSSI